MNKYMPKREKQPNGEVNIDSTTITDMMQAFAKTQNDLSPGNELLEQSIDKIPPEEKAKMQGDKLITDGEINGFLSSIENMTNLP